MEFTGGCVCGGTSFRFAQDRLYQKLMVDPPSFFAVGITTARTDGTKTHFEFELTRKAASNR
jgi:hypothetical protein